MTPLQKQIRETIEEKLLNIAKQTSEIDEDGNDIWVIEYRKVLEFIKSQNEELEKIIEEHFYELEEWYGSAERPEKITCFEANQKNIATRNKILTIIQSQNYE